MDSKEIVSRMTGYLHLATERTAEWLNKVLPKTSDNWWEECVIDNITESQRSIAELNKYSRLEDFDLPALLRIADKSWYLISSLTYAPRRERDVIKDMKRVRNNWAHCGATLPGKDRIVQDITTLESYFDQLNANDVIVVELEEFLKDVKHNRINDLSNQHEEDIIIFEKNICKDTEINVNSLVYVISNPDEKGIVLSISNTGEINKYMVFINGKTKEYYSGQIALYEETKNYKWVDIDDFRSYLTAYQINNPSKGNLYSLNSARIDFVPYQFRPAMKILRSDEPRILIADSVGVGKTIEAGLIIKELQARTDLRNILIVCPKPLVTEQKWELEMKRFDEDFLPMTGPELRRLINDTERDGLWPQRGSRLIIPYSALDERTYEGDSSKGKYCCGLIGLDPEPHFDLVIIDEAHHIRNGSDEKEKAFNYKCVKYFCEHSEAVIMLTATPLQTSDDDLFTLLNVLRPDVVLDKDTFAVMSKPNAYISKCLSYIRAAKDGWQDDAANALTDVMTTQWGEDVVSRNPLYDSSLRMLEKESISREERIQLISNIESLHSFDSIINRTRRRDIQDFCVRRPFTLSVDFTPEQKVVHNDLLSFEEHALSIIHNDVRSIPFMMSTLKRQAASCIFGLAPHIEDWINKRLDEIDEEFNFTYDYIEEIKKEAEQLVDKVTNLPKEDPKFDEAILVINEKQKQENNKIIIFSEYRYTLAYLKRRLEDVGLRVAQIDGSVKDENRQSYRQRFILPKNEKDALDILLFTEVGSEGLDYQFCNMIINYDLPWNPMKIEQRIGRIDRRGQESETVSIYNVITNETVDAEVYNRCLKRIGIFERSIGECEQILGDIALSITRIVDTNLTDEERNEKLEQMADNEVRKIQELSRLEEAEKELFGVDLSEYTTAQDIQKAENPWISKRYLELMVDQYLKARLGEGQYIIGSGEEKTLRLSNSARATLFEDVKKITGSMSAKHQWVSYLKGHDNFHSVTFDSETAKNNRKCFLINAMHPLCIQAASYFESDEKSYLRMRLASNEIEKGKYLFSVYAWRYVGLNPHVKIVTVCENDEVAVQLPELLQESQTAVENYSVNISDWDNLDAKHILLWKDEQEQEKTTVEKMAAYKIQSLDNSYRTRRLSLEQRLADDTDEGMKNMHRGQLEKTISEHEMKRNRLLEQAKKTDLHTTLLANGIVEVV